MEKKQKYYQYIATRLDENGERYIGLCTYTVEEGLSEFTKIANVDINDNQLAKLYFEKCFPGENYTRTINAIAPENTVVNLLKNGYVLGVGYSLKLNITSCFIEDNDKKIYYTKDESTYDPTHLAGYFKDIQQKFQTFDFVKKQEK